MPASVYKSEYCDVVINMMKDGASVTQVAAALGVDRKTPYNWCNDHSEFKEAMTLGYTLSQAWWETHLLKLCRGEYGKVNPAPTIFTMKNRFRDDYRETTDTNINLNPLEKMSNEELNKAVERYMAKTKVESKFI